ncbi:hypothetical protein BpHYR1_012405, partial [Brachionus plicatilis]
MTTDDTSDDENEIVDKPFELKSRFNSKISRALWFVEKDKIKFDIGLKLYFVTDEKNNCFQVKLLPKLSCTCPEKSSCCHILAVQSINGLDISNNYKIPNLTSLTKSKNSGLTGRKKKGHLINSIDPSLNTASVLLPVSTKPVSTQSVSTHPDVRCLLSDLLLETENRDEILD